MALTQIPATMVKDFNLAAVAAGDVLTFDGMHWVPQPGVPAGTILQYAGAEPPNGWLLCDGSAVNRASYAGLFAVLGSLYGEGDGATTFNVPDFRGRVAVGRDNMGIGSANRITSAQADVLGGYGGAELVTPTGSISLSGTVGATTLSTAQIPSHTHTLGWEGVNRSGTKAYRNGQIVDGNLTTNATGDGGSHTHSFSGSGELAGVNMNVTQPWLAINYIIKA